MSPLARLENRFGHWAIPGLIRYVAILNALSYVLWKLYPDFLDFLVLDRARLLQGEVWRLVTYLFIPQVGGILPDWFWMAFYIIYLFLISDGLERAWGAFRVNVYYLLGMLGTTIAVLIGQADPTGVVLNATLLFAFAHFYPDMMFLFMFVLPVKVKWLAWFTAAIMLWNFLGASWGSKLATLVAVMNYFIFFGRELLEDMRTRREIGARRAEFDRKIREGTSDAMHRCHVCGRTEHSDPDTEFRVAADGEEYCAEHLPKRT